MIDRTAKIILAAIALGLWANALSPRLEARAAISTLDALSMAKDLSDVQRNLEDISLGSCANPKLC